MTGDSPDGDGVWAPIEGVDIDRYAALIAEILKRGIVGRDQIEQYVTARGVAPGVWRRVESGWIARIAGHRGVRTRYALMYATATGNPMSR
jgi:hypothetical protein